MQCLKYFVILLMTLSWSHGFAAGQHGRDTVSMTYSSFIRQSGHAGPIAIPPDASAEEIAALEGLQGQACESRGESKAALAHYEAAYAAAPDSLGKAHWAAVLAQGYAVTGDTAKAVAYAKIGAASTRGKERMISVFHGLTAIARKRDLEHLEEARKFHRQFEKEFSASQPKIYLKKSLNKGASVRATEFFPKNGDAAAVSEP